MRILHVSTSQGGGAALAALRLAVAEASIGLEVDFVSQLSGSVILNGSPLREVRLGQRMRQKAATSFNQTVNRLEGTFFSPIEKAVLSLDEIVDLQPDVVHIHNWYNFFDWRLLEPLQARAIALVLTAHDERIITGGCHSTLGCSRCFEGCDVCPQSYIRKVARRPADVLHNRLANSRLEIVAPSYWLTERIRRRFQPSGRENQVRRIPNCLDPLIFAAQPARRDRAASVGIMLGKAPQLLDATLRELETLLGPQDASNVTLNFAGQGQRPSWNGPQRNFGYLSTEQERAAFWQQCDIALAPTLADNFPNVNLEALFTGVFPVTCRVGGAPEALSEVGFGAAVVLDPAALAIAVATALESIDSVREASVGAAERCNSLYGPTPVAREYLSVYETALP